MSVVAMLKNLIRWAVINAIADDTQQFPIHQVDYLGKTADATAWYPFGFHANPGSSTLALLFSLGSNAENRVALPGSPRERIKQLSGGEVVMYHPATGSKVHFKADGSIDMDVKVDLNVTVAGDMLADVGGDITLDAGGDLALIAGGNITAVAGGDIAETAGANVEMTGATGIAMEATAGDIDAEVIATTSNINLTLAASATSLLNLGGVGGKGVPRKDDLIETTGPDKIRDVSTQVKAIPGIGYPG